MLNQIALVREQDEHGTRDNVRHGDCTREEVRIYDTPHPREAGFLESDKGVDTMRCYTEPALGDAWTH